MKNWTNLHNHTVFSMLDGHGDIEEYLTTYTPQYQPQEFIKMYEQDRLGNLIRNVNVWLKECFENLK